VRENGLDAPMPDCALTFPLRLRCASVSALLASDELEAAVARAEGRAFERNQLMGIRLGELYVRMAAQGNRAQLLDIEQARDVVAQAEIFLSSAAPSDPRIGQLDAELRDLAQRVGKWQRRADAGRLNRFVDTVQSIIGH
jgi:hypothetical protein